ncbi:MAG: hypothetical protein ACYCW6_02690 [Candidatus Xenobia bacterium]
MQPIGPVTPFSNAPGGAPAQPQGPQQPGGQDQFVRTWQDQRTGALMRQSQSGVQFSAQGQGNNAVYTAVLPADRLYLGALKIQARVVNGALAQIAAQCANLPLAASLGADGKVAVDARVNNLQAVFDPATLDYGLATKPQPVAPQVPGGQSTYQALKEIVHADGSRSVIAGETDTVVPGANPQGPPQLTKSEFYQFDIKNGQVSARHVTAETVNGDASGTAITAVPMQATQQPDGTLVATPMGTANLPAGISPAMAQLLANPAQPQTVKPFSMYPLTALYGATAGVPTPATRPF